MTGAELTSLREVIGWSGRALAGRLRCDEKLVRNWETGARPVPDKVGRWLASVARAIERLPAPDWR